jgi:hypothetical protein
MMGFTTQDAIELLKGLPKDPRDLLTDEDKQNYLEWVEDTQKKRRRAMESSSHLVLG